MNIKWSTCSLNLQTALQNRDLCSLPLEVGKQFRKVNAYGCRAGRRWSRYLSQGQLILVPMHCPISPRAFCHLSSSFRDMASFRGCISIGDLYAYRPISWNAPLVCTDSGMKSCQRDESLKDQFSQLGPESPPPLTTTRWLWITTSGEPPFPGCKMETKST